MNDIQRLTAEQETELRGELRAADVLIINDEKTDATLQEMLFIVEKNSGDRLSGVYDGYKLGLIRGRKYGR